MRPRSDSSILHAVLVLLVLASVLPFAGCDDDDDDPAAPDSLSGTFADESGTTGTLQIDIQGSSALTSFSALGVVGGDGDLQVAMTVHSSAGDEWSLAGTFDPRTGVLRVADKGFEFDGTLSGDRMLGTCVSPDGSDGVFVALVADGKEITIYCGEFSGDDAGIFSIAVSSSGLALLAATSHLEGPIGSVTGDVNAGTVRFEADDLTVTGDITNGTVDGTWSADLESGEWSGSTAACE